MNGKKNIYYIDQQKSNGGKYNLQFKANHQMFFVFKAKFSSSDDYDDDDDNHGR